MDKGKLEGLFRLQALLRDFFRERDFWDVVPPPMVQHPGLEPHIHPFAVHSVKNPRTPVGYLHTSPEFYMKELLAAGFKNIFAITYCFREEPPSEHHRPQFLMLEWYRAFADNLQMARDCQELLSHCASAFCRENIVLERKSVDELFQEVLQISILDYEKPEDLKKLLARDFPEVPLPSESLDWEDYYFLLFLNKIEPKLKEYPALLIDQFPHHLSSLARIDERDPRVCRRFEIYLRGIELCNCFDELTDPVELRARAKVWEQKKERLYGYRLPPPTRFYQSMDRGLPPGGGIALGIERLYKALSGFWSW